MNAPRLLVFLLATVVVARVAALMRKRVAAQALAWLCIVLGADALIQLLHVDVSGVHLMAALLWASLVMGVGIYMLRSDTVKRFYAVPQ